ncbi:hypothetical protein GCM10010228_58410 [Streptomyces massasporeus]|nr:hypothetical protein GCM10010228_58410 [Streptomyces massasporeus]
MALRPHALLPGRYDHQKVLATTVDAWGRALWLICPDAELHPRSYGRPYPQPRSSPYDALLVIDSGGSVREQFWRDMSLRVTPLDALPDGRFVVQGHTAAGDRNAQIVGRDGRRRRSFTMGRAVEFLMADRRHHVWSAYVDDVDDGVAWANYYPTFPLLEVRSNGGSRLRSTPVTAPAGMAVHEGHVTMSGGDRQPDRLHRCRLTELEALWVEEARLTLPNGAPLERYARPIGRGRHLYLRGTSPRQWCVMGAWCRIRQRSPWAVCDDDSMDEEVIPILRVEDAAAAVAWYERLGFAKQWEHRFEPGLPAFVEVARGGVRLFLSEHTGDARPDTLVYLRIRDVEAVASEFGVQATDAPWAREIELRDPDGNRLRIGTPTE